MSGIETVGASIMIPFGLVGGASLGGETYVPLLLSVLAVGCALGVSVADTYSMTGSDGIVTLGSRDRVINIA